MRSLILWLLVILPGMAASAISVYYLIPEWVVLDASYKHYQQIAKSSSSTVNDLLIAEAAENRHRINCFAFMCRSFVGWGYRRYWHSWHLHLA